MKKKLIKLTESDLHNIIRNSVNKIMKESIDDNLYDGDENDDNDDEIEQDIDPEELDDETLNAGFGYYDDFYGDDDNDDEIEQQIKRGAQQGMIQYNDSVEDPQITKIYDMMNKVDSGEELSDEEKKMASQYAKDIYKNSKRGGNSSYWSDIANSLADGTYSQIAAFNRRNSTPEIDDEIVGESIRIALKKMNLI